MNLDVDKFPNLHSTMEIKRYRTLAIEIYKTLNDLNPAYMRDIWIELQNDLQIWKPTDLKVLNLEEIV